MRHAANIAISENFSEIGTKTIDERNRVTIGDIIKKFYKSATRVKVLIGDDGDILLRPLTEIPAKEAWLYKNKRVLNSVMNGLLQAKEGKIVDFDTSRLS